MKRLPKMNIVEMAKLRKVVAENGTAKQFQQEIAGLYRLYKEKKITQKSYQHRYEALLENLSQLRK